jgi:gas vesicle protein
MSNNTHSVLIGALLGGLLTGVSVAFLASPRGKRLREELSEKCHECSDKMEDTFEDFMENLQEKRKSFSSGVQEQSLNWSDKAEQIAAFVKVGLDALSNPEHRKFKDGIVIGALAGSVLGIGTSLVLHSVCCHQEAKGSCSLNDKIYHCKSMFNDVLQSLHPGAVKTARAQSFSDVMQLAMAGVHLWESLKKKM